jgi:hypothetical protein
MSDQGGPGDEPEERAEPNRAPTSEGRAGPAQRLNLDDLQGGEANADRLTPEELAERQRALGSRRRPLGPPLEGAEGAEAAEGAAPAAPGVPETGFEEPGRPD